MESEEKVAVSVCVVWSSRNIDPPRREEGKESPLEKLDFSFLAHVFFTLHERKRKGHEHTE